MTEIIPVDQTSIEYYVVYFTTFPVYADSYNESNSGPYCIPGGFQTAENLDFEKQNSFDTQHKEVKETRRKLICCVSIGSLTPEGLGAFKKPHTIFGLSAGIKEPHELQEGDCFFVIPKKELDAEGHEHIQAERQFEREKRFGRGYTRVLLSCVAVAGDIREAERRAADSAGSSASNAPSSGKKKPKPATRNKRPTDNNGVWIPQKEYAARKGIQESTLKKYREGMEWEPDSTWKHDNRGNVLKKKNPKHKNSSYEYFVFD